MNKNIKLYCVNCDNNMDMLSGSGINNRVTREIWECSKCHVEVMTTYEEKNKK